MKTCALYARTVENGLRKDFKQFSPLIEIEISVEGYVVKAIAGNDVKSFSDRRVVPFERSDYLIEAIDETDRVMRDKMGARV